MYRRIRDLREDKDLYQKDLAEYLKCTQVCYSHYEMGKRDRASPIRSACPAGMCARCARR